MQSKQYFTKIKNYPHEKSTEPGFVATPLLKDDKYPLLMNVSAVAAHIINALNKKKRTVIIDRRYQVLVFFWRLIPKWLWVKLPVKN